jgi:hypothetical protein
MNLFATVIIAQTRFVVSVRTHLVVIEEMNSVVGHVTMMASVQFHFFAGKEKTATDSLVERKPWRNCGVFGRVSVHVVRLMRGAEED